MQHGPCLTVSGRREQSATDQDQENRRAFPTQIPRRTNFNGACTLSQFFIGSPSNQQPSSAAYRTPLLTGEPGTAQTVALMRRLIDDALADSQFVRTAIDIVRSVRAFDDFGEAEALYSWVKRHIRFTKDPVTKEKLYPPQELLKIGAGDCDDISMLLGAFLLAVGYPARLITVSANRDNPSEFSHVYVEGEVPPGSGQWVPMDAARANSEFGVEPPTYFRKRAWSLVDDSFQDLSGGRLRGSLSGYVGLADGIDLNTTIAEIPAIISAASGGSSSYQTPYGSGQTAPPSPWGSFATPYTPGYGIPPAGYGGNVALQTSGLGQLLPWLGIGLLAMFIFGKGRR